MNDSFQPDTMQWPASIPHNPSISHSHGFSVVPLQSSHYGPLQLPLHHRWVTSTQLQKGSITASKSETCCQWKGSLLHAINLYCTLSPWPSPNGQQSSAVLGRIKFSHRVKKTPDTLEFAFIYWPYESFCCSHVRAPFPLPCFDLPGFCCGCILRGPFRSSTHFLLCPNSLDSCQLNKQWLCCATSALGQRCWLPKLTPNGSLVDLWPPPARRGTISSLSLLMKSARS